MTPTDEPTKPTDTLTLDRQGLHALAHPLRMRLVGLLRLEGPATASELARRLGTNSGATSYHLRRLADAGLIEEAAELGTRRDRHWRATAASSHWHETQFADDPDDAAAAAWLSTHVVHEHRRWLEDYWAERHDLDDQWQRAAGLHDIWLDLDPEELEGVQLELLEVLGRWQRRPSTRSGAAERVVVLVQAFPSAGPTA
jgi:DNA-binding transcriptional ArsR family regulator